MMKNLSQEAKEELLKSLKVRFEKHMIRHEGMDWAALEAKLEADPQKLWSLNEMERTGGEPDVVGYDQETGEVIFYDCSPESPEGRRSLCYDDQALESRKKNKPAGSAMGMVEAMGVNLMTEKEYQELQKLGDFDTKNSSWLETPSNIRALAARPLAIGATMPSGFIITVRIHTMPPGVSALP